MNKYILLVLILFFVIKTQAQQNQYNWKIGVHGGFSTYYGDLSHQFFDVHHKMTAPFQNLDFWAYGLSLEYHVNHFFAVKLMGLKSQIVGNDRIYDNSANYNRGLNFQTDIIDVSLLGVFYLDNGVLFGHKAVISPYFLIGGGLTYFESRGDLHGSNGSPYYYWSDNTIRSQEEKPSNLASAQLIEQNQQYETALRPLKTEGFSYQPFTWNLTAGMGFKFRLSKRFHLHLEAMIKYTGTDYLDDVGGDYLTSYTNNLQAYAANPTQINKSNRGTSPKMNDWYGFIGLSLHYSFGQKTYEIRPSIIYTPSLVLTDTLKINEIPLLKEKKDSIVSASKITTKKVTTTTTTVTKTSETSEEIEVDSVIIKNKKEENIKIDNQQDTSLIFLQNTAKIDSLFLLDSTGLEVKDSSEILEKSATKIDSVSSYNNKNNNDNSYNKNKDNLELNSLQQRHYYELELLKQDYENQLKIQKIQNELTLEKAKKAPSINSSEQELQRLKLEQDLKFQKQEMDYQLKVKDLQHALELEKLKNNKTSFRENTKVDSVIYVKTENPENKVIIADNNRNLEVEKKLDKVLEKLEIQQKKNDDLTGNSTTKNSTTNNATELDKLAALKIQNDNLQLKIQLLEKGLGEPLVSTDTIRIVQRDSIFISLGDGSENEEITKKINIQKEFNEDLTKELDEANQVINQQKTLVDSLLLTVNQLKKSTATKSSELESFLSKEVASHITKIYFDVNKTALTMQAEETLTTLVRHLENYPDVHFLVKGFASKSGNTVRNNELSSERAKVVAGYLEKMGLEVNRIKTASLGDTQTSDNNDVDRRAEIHLHF